MPVTSTPMATASARCPTAAGRSSSASCERSESHDAPRRSRQFITAWLEDIGIATDVQVMDDTAAVRRAGRNGKYDMFVWGWTPFVDPDPMLSYFTCAQVTTDPDNPGSTMPTGAPRSTTSSTRPQNVELDPTKRREIVAEMLRLFNRESTYLVLLQDPDTQAYRTDRFEGWTQQPADAGPVRLHEHVTDVRQPERHRQRRVVREGGGSPRRKRSARSSRSASCCSSTSSCSGSSRDDPIGKLFRGRNMTPEQLDLATPPVQPRRARSSLSSSRTSDRR